GTGARAGDGAQRAAARVKVADPPLAAVLRAGLSGVGGLDRNPADRREKRKILRVVRLAVLRVARGVVDPALRGRVDRGDALGDPRQTDLAAGERAHQPEPLVEDLALGKARVDAVERVVRAG